MAGTDPATGITTPHGDVVQALQPDGPGITPVMPPTAVAASTGPDRLDAASYGGVFDATASLTAQMAQQTAEATAAQSAGMDARDSMLSHYEAQAMPLGGQIGDNLVLPVVPDNAVIASSSDDYPWPGDEPVPSSAGPGYYGGDEPKSA